MTTPSVALASTLSSYSLSSTTVSSSVVVAASPSPSGLSNSARIGILAGILGGVGVIVIIAVVVVVARKKSKVADGHGGVKMAPSPSET